jgi:hypothetical protein
MISSIGFALTPSINQMIKTAFSTGNTEDKQSPNDLKLVSHVFGEALKDPRPNKSAKV